MGIETSVEVMASNVIVKIQTALTGPPSVLIYTMGRKHVGQFPYTESVRRTVDPILKGEAKAFAVADVVKVNGEMMFEIHGEAPCQDW